MALGGFQRFPKLCRNLRQTVSGLFGFRDTLILLFQIGVEPDRHGMGVFLFLLHIAFPDIFAGRLRSKK